MIGKPESQVRTFHVRGTNVRHARRQSRTKRRFIAVIDGPGRDAPDRQRHRTAAAAAARSMGMILMWAKRTLIQPSSFWDEHPEPNIFPMAP
jgi:hypothetical protein